VEDIHAKGMVGDLIKAVESVQSELKVDEK
jgi:hypothetical protein